MDLLGCPQPGGLIVGGRPAIREVAGSVRESAHVNDELLQITCPRCGVAVAERFYGPCGTCREELRATVSGERREIEAAVYEPKMNVTPNAVALKE